MPDRGTDAFDELERVFDQMSRQFASGPFGGGSVPVDLREKPNRFVLEAELPGFSPEDVDLRVSEGRRVEIAAERGTEEEAMEEGAEETEAGAGAGEYVLREMHRESKSRSVTLPEPVDDDATEATYDAGVLTVTLPKRSADGQGTDIPVS